MMDPVLTPPTAWTADALAARIQNRGVRYEAGSPNPEEIALYTQLLPQTPLKTAMVLGMTPELRQMLVDRDFNIIAADNNVDAIALYRDWNAKPERETLLTCNWLRLSEQSLPDLSVIVGDGVLPNLAEKTLQATFLNMLYSMLLPTKGVFITRQPVIPEAWMSHPPRWQDFLQDFRQGRINEAEWGLTFRLFGFLPVAYDPETALLDNAKVFEAIDALLEQKALTAEEYAVVKRYYFTGLNLLWRQSDWEALLQSAGFGFECHALTGKLWYTYYPVYRCQAGL